MNAPRDEVISVTVGVVILLVYGITLAPTLTGGDAGELIAAVSTGGVPHPPGYPLYALLTKPFTWLPVHNVAWRVNLASAVFAAAAAAALAWSIMRATNLWWAGATAALLFAFTPVVWLYATSAEVFSLNNLLLAIQLCLFVAVERATRPARPPQSTRPPQSARNEPGLVLAGAFVLGLGVSNHHTSVVFNFILLAAMVWRTRGHWVAMRPVATLAACVATGLLPYAYLPIAAAGDAAVSWGDPSTLNGFVAQFLRRDYGTFQLASTQGVEPLSLLAQLAYYARDVVRQISWAGVALAAWGLVQGVINRGDRFMAGITFVAFSAYLIAFHSLANLPLDQPLIRGVVARFWQAPNLVICFWAGLGVASLAGLVRASTARAPQLNPLAPVALGFALILAWTHVDEARIDGAYIVHDYGASMLSAAPANALILTRGDLMTNAVRYLHSVEGYRPDVRVLDMEMLTYRWMNARMERTMPDIAVPGSHYDITDPNAYTIAGLIDANIARRPVVLCGGWKPGDDTGDRMYTRTPSGLCDAITPRSANARVVSRRIDSPHGAAVPQFRDDMRLIPDEGSWERIAWSEHWASRHRHALTFLTLAIERGDDPELLRNAVQSFDRLIADHPAVPPSHYKDLGIARARLAATDTASAASAIAAFTRYLELVPRDSEAPAIMQVVRDLRAARPLQPAGQD